MSNDAVYAIINHHQKHTPDRASDDATYSNIHFPVSGRCTQQTGESHCVIYSTVSLPSQDDTQPASTSEPADPTPRTPSTERFWWQTLQRPKILLFFLSALLLVVIFTLVGLYASSEVFHKERYYALEKNNSEINNRLVQLQSALSNRSEEKTILWHQLNKMNNQLVQLQSALSNRSEEKTLLWHQLNKTQTNLTQLLRNYTALSREKTEIQSERDSLKTQIRKKCPGGWEYFNEKCYKFSSTEMSWDKSKYSCETMGGHLVIIESPEEQQYINSRQRRGEYWIGLRKEDEQWRWVDNTLLIEPNFSKYYWGDCVRMILQVDNSWNPKPWKSHWCGANCRSICESKAAT